jgi:hypothetical protein
MDNHGPHVTHVTSCVNAGRDVWQGDKHKAYDVLLVTPLLLVSKVCIFNHKGLPNKSSTLDQLTVLCNAAKQVQLKHRKHVFGHLILLLRDCDQDATVCEDIIFRNEVTLSFLSAGSSPQNCGSSIAR